MPPSLGARRRQRCQDLADLRAAGVAPQRGRRDPEAPAETGGEVAVAGEAQRDADGGETASRLEHLVERRRQPYTQLVAVQRHAGELPESAREVPGRAVPPPRQPPEAPRLAGLRGERELGRLDDVCATRPELPLRRGRARRGAGGPRGDEGGR